MSFRLSAKVVSLGVMASVMLAAGMSYAGYTSRDNVSVGTGFMAGSMYGARHSSRSGDEIMCSVNSSIFGSPQMNCFANANNVYKSCASYDPELVQAALALDTYSRIYVAFDTSGACTELDVSYGSRYLP